MKDRAEYYLIDNLNENEKIYEDSNTSLGDFYVGYLTLVSKLKLSLSHPNILLDFIKCIIPQPNIIPRSYNILSKSFSKSKVVEKKICSMCSIEIINNKYSCEVSESTLQSINYIYVHDVKQQMNDIIIKEYATLKSYLSTF